MLKVVSGWQRGKSLLKKKGGNVLIMVENCCVAGWKMFEKHSKQVAWTSAALILDFLNGYLTPGETTTEKTWSHLLLKGTKTEMRGSVSPQDPGLGYVTSGCNSVEKNQNLKEKENNSCGEYQSGMTFIWGNIWVFTVSYSHPLNMNKRLTSTQSGADGDVYTFSAGTPDRLEREVHRSEM